MSSFKLREPADAPRDGAGRQVEVLKDGNSAKTGRSWYGRVIKPKVSTSRLFASQLVDEQASILDMADGRLMEKASRALP